jgi:hypothetical protein
VKTTHASVPHTRPATTSTNAEELTKRVLMALESPYVSCLSYSVCKRAMEVESELSYDEGLGAPTRTTGAGSGGRGATRRFIASAGRSTRRQERNARP